VIESGVPPLVLTRSGNAGRAISSSQPVTQSPDVSREQAPRSIMKSVYDRDGWMSSQKNVYLFWTMHADGQRHFNVCGTRGSCDENRRVCIFHKFHSIRQGWQNIG
jgi:hypothetical protein